MLKYSILLAMFLLSFHAYETSVKTDSIKKISLIQKKQPSIDEKIQKEWFKIIKKWEGGATSRPLHEDPSGLTNHGITMFYWRTSAHKIVGKKPTPEALKTLTWKETEKITKSFWKTYKIDSVKNPVLRIMVAEAYWGSGSKNALRSFGYKSIKHLNSDKNVTPTILHKRRLSWLMGLKNWEYNKDGWMNRMRDDLKTAKKFQKKIKI